MHTYRQSLIENKQFLLKYFSFISKIEIDGKKMQIDNYVKILI